MKSYKVDMDVNLKYVRVRFDAEIVATGCRGEEEGVDDERCSLWSVDIQLAILR